MSFFIFLEQLMEDFESSGRVQIPQDIMEAMKTAVTGEWFKREEQHGFSISLTSLQTHQKNTFSNLKNKEDLTNIADDFVIS